MMTPMMVLAIGFPVAFCVLFTGVALAEVLQPRLETWLECIVEQIQDRRKDAGQSATTPELATVPVAVQEPVRTPTRPYMTTWSGGD